MNLLAPLRQSSLANASEARKQINELLTFVVVNKIRQLGWKKRMNSSNFKLCEKFIPGTYVKQGYDARRILENRIKQLLEQVSGILLWWAWSVGFRCSRQYYGLWHSILRALVHYCIWLWASP